MKNHQHTSLTFDLLVGCGVIAVIYLVHLLIKHYMPHILPYVPFVIFGAAFIGVSIYAYRLDMKIPGKPLERFTSMLQLLTILVIAFLVIDFFDDTSEIPEWFLPIGFVTLLMWSAYSVFKQQQKRIDALEEELKQQKLLQKLNQQKQKEQSH